VKESRAPRGTRITGGVAIGIVGLLAALAVTFGNASGTQQAAQEAVAAQHIEATLGSLAAFRTVLGQALLVAEASPESGAIPILIDDARLLSAQLEERFTATSEALREAGLDLAFDPSPTFAATGAMLEALSVGGVETAGDRAVELAAEIDALTAVLTSERNTLATSLAAAGQQAGRVATAARFMVALGIPGAALMSWAAIARKRRRREENLAALEYEREVNRSKDQLIANISHELRTPLTGIYAAARTLTDVEDPDPDLTDELTGVIVEQSIELTRMVEDLLVSAQAGAQRLSLAIQELDVEETVTHVVDEFARTGTIVEYRCEPATLAADPLRLRQILRNLISNARNHGGNRTWIEGRASPDGYRLTVSDNGGGVPDEIEDRLFTPFVHQGDLPLITGSVGLGLSITRVLADAMGGHVEYRREDSITHFVVRLPVPPEDPSPAVPAERVAERDPELAADH